MPTMYKISAFTKHCADGSAEAAAAWRVCHWRRPGWSCRHAEARRQLLRWRKSQESRSTPSPPQDCSWTALSAPAEAHTRNTLHPGVLVVFLPKMIKDKWKIKRTYIQQPTILFSINRRRKEQVGNKLCVFAQNSKSNVMSAGTKEIALVRKWWKLYNIYFHCIYIMWFKSGYVLCLRLTFVYNVSNTIN